MKKLRILRIGFDAPIHLEDVAAFRGAIAQKVGKEHTFYHQHINEADGSSRLRMRYPLIQYKCIHHNAALVCLDEAVDHIHYLFGNPNWNLSFSDKQYSLHIAEMYLHQFNLKVYEKTFHYRITNWLALNQKNYFIYKEEKETLTEQIAFLQRLLINHIVNFARGVGWYIDQPIKLDFTDMPRIKLRRFKGVPLMAFHVNFKCNVFLPNYISLGKGASHGFGIVRSIRKNQRPETSSMTQNDLPAMVKV